MDLSDPLNSIQFCLFLFASISYVIFFHLFTCHIFVSFYFEAMWGTLEEEKTKICVLSIQNMFCREDAQ